MDAKKMGIVTGAALAGALLARSLPSKLHEHCAAGCPCMPAQAPEDEEPRDRACSPQAVRHAA